MFRLFGESAGYNPEKLPPLPRRNKGKSPDIIPATVVEKAARVAEAQAKLDEVEWERLKRYRDTLTQTTTASPKQPNPAEMVTETPKLPRPAGAPSTQDLLADLRHEYYAPTGTKRGKVLAQELVAELLAEQPAHEKSKTVRARPNSLAETRPIPPQDSSRLRSLMQRPEIDPNLVDTVPAARVDAPLPPRPDSDTKETNQLFASSQTETETAPFFDPNEIEIPDDLGFDDLETTTTDSKDNPVVARPPRQETSGELEDIDVEHYLFPEIEPLPEQKFSQTPPKTQKMNFVDRLASLIPKRQSGLKMDSATTYYPPNYQRPTEQSSDVTRSRQASTRGDNVIQFPRKKPTPEPTDPSSRWAKIKQELEEPRESGWKKLLSPFRSKKHSGLNLETTVYHPDVDEKRDAAE